MLYKLAHSIQLHCPSIWNLIEHVNDWLFALRYHRSLAVLSHTDLGTTRLASDHDIQALVDFFATQSKESFTYFQPHLFDIHSIYQLIHRRSMVMFVTYANHQIIGYAFLRCFWLGKAYRGYMVDEQYRGQGIGKQLGQALNTTQRILHINTYKSISPNNTASLSLAKATCQLLPRETTSNGDVCYQCLLYDEKTI